MCINLTRSAEGVTHLTFPPIPASSFHPASCRPPLLNYLIHPRNFALASFFFFFFFFNIVQTLSFHSNAEMERERNREREFSVYSSFSYISYLYIYFNREFSIFFNISATGPMNRPSLFFFFRLVVRTITLPSGPPTRVATSTSLPRLLLPLYAPAPRSWITVIRGFLYIMRAYASLGSYASPSILRFFFLSSSHSPGSRQPPIPVPIGKKTGQPRELRKDRIK